jgi:hypothetical protein
MDKVVDIASEVCGNEIRFMPSPAISQKKRSVWTFSRTNGPKKKH